MFDTHAHLDHLEDIPGALQRAWQSGVKSIIAVSEELKSCQKNWEIKKQFSQEILPSSNRCQDDKVVIYLGCGIHPSYAHIENLDSVIEFIKEHRSDISLIGEIGLDYWYRWVRKNDDIKLKQQENFKKLLQISKDYQLPVSIHSRGAWKDTLDIVKDFGIKQAVFHWYSGPLDVLEVILSSGYFVSATPSLAYSKEAQAAIERVPVQQLLVETDSPVYYRNPETDAGFNAEPKDVWKTWDLICKLRSFENQESALTQVIHNAERFISR